MCNRLQRMTAAAAVVTVAAQLADAVLRQLAVLVLLLYAMLYGMSHSVYVLYQGGVPCISIVCSLALIRTFW